MRRLMQLIFLSCVMMISTQCGGNHEPDIVPPQEVEPPQETWELSYDDYHFLLYGGNRDSLLLEYCNLKRTVKITRDSDVLSIKGIFREYPDTWVKFYVKGDSVYPKSYQVIDRTDKGLLVCFHCGPYSVEGHIGMTSYMKELILEPKADKAALVISDNGKEMRGVKEKWQPCTNPFWYGRIGILRYWEGENKYYDENDTPYWKYSGTGFPDTGFMTNMVFRKVSDAEDDIIR